MRVEQLHQTGAQCHRVKYCYQHTQLSSLQNVNKWTKQLLWITRLSTEPCQSARVSVEEFQHSSDSEPRLECRILPEPAEKCQLSAVWRRFPHRSNEWPPAEILLDTRSLSPGEVIRWWVLWCTLRSGESFVFTSLTFSYPQLGLCQTGKKVVSPLWPLPTSAPSQSESLGSSGTEKYFLIGGGSH